jgi:hypothetical protein
MPDDDQFVYIIAHTSKGRPCAPVKIGITNRPEKRLQNLQTASSIGLILFHSFPMPVRWMARAIETAFHQTQIDKRLRGEWFNVHPVVALQLMCINIRSALYVHGQKLSEKEKQMVLEVSGVLSAEEKLRTVGAIIPGDVGR